MTTDRTADLDVAIIGAGAAGIAAARAIIAQGFSCRLLEARGRIGGRAWTDTDSLGVPFDRGCAWLHEARRNPLRPLAEHSGISCAGGMELRYCLEDGFADSDKNRDIQHFLNRNFQCMTSTGRAGRDVAASEVMEHGHPYSPLLDNMIAAINGVEAGRYATGEAAADEDLGDNLIVREGLGTLIVDRLAEGLPVVVNCPVRTVDYSGESVRLETDSGELRARAVIVTAPTGVLAAGAIRFKPELPGWKQTALEAVPMGKAEKVGLSFDGDVFGLGENTFVNILRGDHACGFHLRPFGYPVAIWYSGGQLAEQVATMPPADAQAMALDYLEHAFGAAPRQRLRGSTVTAWSRDIWSQGAYSAAVPGGHHQRDELARPLSPRVHFAGEATEPQDFATAHGAWQSGIRAATAVAAELSAKRVRVG